MKFCLLLLACIAVSFYSFSQSIPESPNVTDEKGLRQGKWTLMLDANSVPVTDHSKGVYYRLISYVNDKPVGVVKDYYISGNVKWEGFLIQDRPAEVYDGENVYYHESGNVHIKKVFNAGNLISEVYFNLDGSVAQENYDALSAKGFEEFNAGKYKETVVIFEKAHEQSIKEYGKESSVYGESLNNLAYLYNNVTFQYAKSETLYLESKAIREKLLGKESLEYAESLNNLSALYLRMGLLDKSIAYMKEGMEIRGRILGKAHADYGSSVNNLAVIYEDIGDYSKSEEMYLEALKIREVALGKEHPDYAVSLSNLAHLYLFLNNLSAASKLFDQAEATWSKIENKPIEYLAFLQNKALLASKQGNFQVAELEYLEVANKIKTYIGKDPIYYGNTLNDLAHVYIKTFQYSKAKTMFEELMNIQVSTNGKNTLYYSRSLNNVMNLYMRMGEYLLAEQVGEESKRIAYSLFGKRHPLYIAVAVNLLTVYYIQGQTSRVSAFYDEAARAILSIIKDYFLALSEREKDLFYQSIKGYIEGLCSFAFSSGLIDEKLLEKTFNLQLSIKGLLFNDSDKIRKRVLNSKDDSLIQTYNSWRYLKNSMVKMYQMSFEERKKKGINIDSLTDRITFLEKKLSKQSQLFHSDYDTTQYTWRDVKNHLRKDEAAIEVIRFRKFGTQKIVQDTTTSERLLFPLRGLTDTVYYAALIVTSTSKVPEYVIFQNGRDLEDRYFRLYKNSIKFKLNDTISYYKFWGPIATVLSKKKIKNVYLSPDGIYNLINLNAMKNPETGKYVIDNVHVHVVTNSKFWLSKNVEKRKIRNVSLFGFPKYNTDTVKVIKNEERGLSPAVVNSEMNRLFDAGMITELPGTQKEVVSIQNLLAVDKINVREYQGSAASEEEMKLLSNPDVLHIATHGFFLEDTGSSDEWSFTGADEKEFVRNPLLRSGLLLAGSQQAISGRIDPASEDGILTAYEAMNLNLDETDLVVLSACETGLGEIRNGEGVYGLQRAFQTAGARSVLMSLWKVDDNATQELMIEFYRNWLKSGDKQAAFKKAQASVRKSNPHPYYWGAFVLVGD